MDKLKMMSMDNVQENIKKIQALFPNAVTEVLRDGKPTLAVDFDVLKQEMSNILIDDREERYQFTWPDKKKSILLANSPISATLRPCVEESVDFDNTQNLYIEGDNLDVLKLLQETYLGKIKMIYIDPPYNTGNDFVYNDDFAQSSDEYLANSGQYDDQGNRLMHNTDSNGRFHTDWLNMIYPRIKIAKDLLTDDGAIFISIDENEVTNLKKVCDEIFGAANYLVSFIWKSKGSGAYDSSQYKTEHEYIVGYAKNTGGFIANRQAYDTASDSAYSLIDERYSVAGKYKRQALSMGTLSYSESLDYPMVCPDGSVIYPGGKFGPPYAWRYSKSKMEKALSGGFAEFVLTRNGWSLYSKQYERMDDQGNIISRDKPYSSMGLEAMNRNGTELIKKIFNGRIFDYPKPLDVPSFLCNILPTENEIILDFFSGSATTAHAVMELNAQDGGKRKFIMVQLPEACDEKSEAYKSGYKNICEIGKERIRRAGKKILGTLWADNKPGVQSYSKRELDVGFRVLKLDSSNMKDVFYRPGDYSQGLLGMLESNIKEDRTPLDLLFQVMLELGKPLSAKIVEKVIAGKKVFVVDDNDLVACFDEDITEEVVKTIAQMQPLYAVFRDNSFSSDTVAANFDQIFATYSPATTRKVL